MNAFKQINNFTKVTFISGIIFILYGYLCRIYGLYFFWESKSIGWTFLFIGLISFLSNKIKIKTTEQKNTLLEKVGIGIVILILLVQSIFIAVIPYTDAYSVAKACIINDINLKSEIGNITGFGLIPSGGIQKTTDSSGEYGNATFNLTVKGDKKFKDISIYLVKNPDNTVWEVVVMQ